MDKSAASDSLKSSREALACAFCFAIPRHDTQTAAAAAKAARTVARAVKAERVSVMNSFSYFLCAARDGNVGHAVVEQVLRRIHGAGWEVERGVAKGA
jgi:hypothetical protein